jgi:hypothetical protein
MASWVSVEDAAQLLGVTIGRVRELCNPNRPRPSVGILKPVWIRPPHRCKKLGGIETQSIVEYLAFRATRYERSARSMHESRERLRRACPRCEQLTDDGDLCADCRRELAGTPYYYARPVETIAARETGVLAWRNL